MTADELRALQAPVKARYKEDPSAAVRVLRANGKLQAVREPVRDTNFVKPCKRLRCGYTGS